MDCGIILIYNDDDDIQFVSIHFKKSIEQMNYYSTGYWPLYTNTIE